jgi:16S rRNA (cytidine1402-2'-O)-methyltransferase
MTKGKVLLIPMSLGGERLTTVIPQEVIELAVQTRYFAVENIKTARRYLRKLDRDFPIDDSTFFELNKRTEPSELAKMLAPIYKGHDVAIISEAGCPGVADPGADLVALAHQNGLFVSPFTGPSSILLGLMASGFNGQSFVFHGYLPRERKQRISAIKNCEKTATKTGQTQLFMETPFRNMNMLEDLLNECLDTTFLCIACDLTMPTERVQTMTVADWRKNAFDLSKRPTMFLIGRPFSS